MLGHVPIVSPLTGVTGGGQEGRLVCDLQNTMATICFIDYLCDASTGRLLSWFSRCSQVRSLGKNQTEIVTS